MSRTETLRPEFVEFIPGTLHTGILYISRKYKTASHLCCCGCGNKVVTPLNPSGWKLTDKGNAITLHPSIGNWSFACQSHYWIRGNRIEWTPKWSRREIEEGRLSDRLAQQRIFDQSRDVSRGGAAWRRIKEWFKRVFVG
jgi:hypothetical protein